MKNVKKLLKKAMVFTVAASMLVGTPLTASAAGIRGVYSVSDGTNDDIKGEGDSSHTGTVTNTDTNTNSGVIKDNDAKIIGIVLDQEYVNAEKGKKVDLTATIVLDGDLVDGDKDQDAIVKELEDKIKWEVTYADGSTVQNNVAANKVLSISAKAGNRKVVTLNPRQGTKLGEEMIVKATIDGSYRFYVDEEGNVQKEELKDGWNKTEDYTAEAKVFIKEYSDNLKLEGMPTAYLKHTLDMNDYLVRDPKTANDTITWISSDPKLASITAAGVVTFKKATKENETVTIYAVGEKCEPAEWTTAIETGVQSSRIEIIDSSTDDLFKNSKGQTKKADVDIKDVDNWGADAEVVMYAKVKNAVVSNTTASKAAATVDDAKQVNGKYKTGNVEVKDGDVYYFVEKAADGTEELVAQGPLAITDTITWTSNKPAIVSVEPNGDQATLYANGVGTAVVSAKASSGKADKLTVAVKATLTGLEITDAPGELYSGQTYQMTFDRTPAENKDAVKWSIAKVEVNGKLVPNKNASINAKGILTIKPKLDLAEEYKVVTVVLESKTKPIDSGEVGNNGKPVMVAATDSVDIVVSQSSIDGITVTDDQGEPIAKVETTYNSNGVGKVTQAKLGDANTTTISVPKNRTYTATVTPSKDLDYEAGADTLTWKTSNAKIASVEPAADGTAKITAVGSGKATITVSGIRAVNKPDGSLKSAGVIKTTFKVDVKQPVKTVTLNKPSVVLNEKTKKAGQVTTIADQKVALKATLGPKGVGKKELVHWSVEQIKGTDKVSGKTPKELGLAKANGDIITTANINVNLPAPEVGDVFEITARTDSGASATSTVQIVNKTTGVAIASKATLDKDGKPVLYSDQTKPNGNTIPNTKVVTIGDKFEMYPFINIDPAKNGNDWKAQGTDNTETVTYSVNKKGIVNIDSDGNVYALNKGVVTITAKTPLGKKATLKVTVNLQ